MKAAIKYLLLVVLFSTAAQAQTAVSAERFTASGNSIVRDLGTYNSQGHFVVLSANRPFSGTIAPNVLTAISGKAVIAQAAWALEEPYVGSVFSVSSTTYLVGGVPYVILSLKSRGGGSGGGGSDGSTSATRFINISTRAVIAAGGNLNPGFVIGGTGKKSVLIRAVGPTLASFGVGNTLADPMLTVYAGQAVIATNDDWSANATQAIALRAAATATGAFALTEGSKDAAILLNLDPGTYTAIVKDSQGRGGDVLVEVYEAP